MMNDSRPSNKSDENIMAGRMALNHDFKEFLQLLNDHDVRYLVVGGYALALHGHPRYTKDLDIWFDNEKVNAEKLMQVLTRFGFGSLNIELEDLTSPDKIIQLGYPPNRIDLITMLDGVTFGECFKSKQDVSIDELTINVIDLASFRKNKRAVGRHQDLADLENLE
jgi:hypothetical protein